MRQLRALLLNCTLKNGPEPSNTEALMREVMAVMESRGVTCEIVRMVDQKAKFGVLSDEGPGDGWPKVHEKVLSADILVIGTPIWWGKLSSVAQMTLERLDGMLSETNDKGQLPLYNKVAGTVITGNEDGAQNASSGILHDLMQLGATIPPNAIAYWVGDAGPGPPTWKPGATASTRRAPCSTSGTTSSTWPRSCGTTRFQPRATFRNRQRYRRDPQGGVWRGFGERVELPLQ